MDVIKTTIDDVEVEVITKEDFELEQATLQERIDVLEADITKEKEKDKNFSGLRYKNKEIEGEKKAIEDQLKELNEKMALIEENTFKSTTKRLLEVLSGGEEDKKTKIMEEYNGFAGEVKTSQEVEQRMLKAAKLAGYSDSLDDIFLAGVGIGGGESRTSNNQSFADTERGKATAKRAGMKWAQDKK